MVRRRPHGWYRDFHVGRVDNAPFDVHLIMIARECPEMPITLIFAHGEVGNPACRQQLLLHYRVEVGINLTSGGELV